MNQRKKKERKNKKGNLLRQRKNKSIILLFIFAIFFSIILTEIVYFVYNIQYVKIIPVKLQIGNKIGFALGSSELNFGIIPAGSSALLYAMITNSDNKDLIVQIIPAGDIKHFLQYDNNLIVKMNETKKVSFIASIPEGAQPANYTGKIFLIFKRA